MSVNHILKLGRLKKDRQYAYKRNIEARSRNHFYGRKGTNIAYSERVSVDLVIQRGMHMRRGLSGSTIFYHFVS